MLVFIEMYQTTPLDMCITQIKVKMTLFLVSFRLLLRGKKDNQIYTCIKFAFVSYSRRKIDTNV